MGLADRADGTTTPCNQAQAPEMGKNLQAQQPRGVVSQDSVGGTALRLKYGAGRWLLIRRIGTAEHGEVENGMAGGCVGRRPANVITRCNSNH